jgi:riboflavin synthase
MFSGIIENLGTVRSLRKEGSNVHMDISCDFLHEIYIDQSIAHNGVCLTVVGIGPDHYTVTAVLETLERSNLGKLQPGDSINLERSVRADMRMDGHFVQGHVDTTAICTGVKEADGSWYFDFEIDRQYKNYLVDKGSICINGVSLTVIHPTENHFSVAIIPYTYAHTNFKFLKPGDVVNIEFDILGKYILKYLENLNLPGR